MALIDVGGVGYEVQCSGRTLATLDDGEAVHLIIETHVREDHIHLFGFPSVVERSWFRLLTDVQRVGNRMALQILNALPPASLQQAILAKDTTAFSRISGIGPKLAERIVGELKDKALSLPVDGSMAAPAPLPVAGSATKTKAAPIPSPVAAVPLEDAVSALVNLGYGRAEAYGAVAQAAKDAPGADLDRLIPLALKQLVRA